MHFNAFDMTREKLWKRNVNKGPLCIFTRKLNIFLHTVNLYKYIHVHRSTCIWPINVTFPLINHLIHVQAFLNGPFIVILLHIRHLNRVSVQGVKSLGGHFACLCRGFDFYEVKKKSFVFQKKIGNTSTLLIRFKVKSLQKEQIAQITRYEPQSSGINLQPPQSDSTPWTLTLPGGFWRNSKQCCVKTIFT